ncbi:hypothetical protein NMT49_003429 [Vibrio cholerae]|nr:hypothetical protein [Vibrio cholerae]EKF9477956.1 hypothetical protein [Vibrio cholerae]
MNFDSYKKRVIYHEVGHWLVAKTLGFGVGSIKIRVDANSRGFGHAGSSHVDIHPSLNNVNDVEKYLLDRLSILWGGIASQTVVDKRDWEKILSTDAESDYNKTRELAYILRGLRYPSANTAEMELEQIDQITDETYQIAVSIINNNEKAWNNIAKNITSVVAKRNHDYEFTREQLIQWMSAKNDA